MPKIEYPGYVRGRDMSSHNKKKESVSSTSKFIVSSNPHIRDTENVKSIMWSVFISLIPASLVGIYIFGTNALILIVVSILTCVITEAVIQKMLGRKITVDDGSAALTGLLLALIIAPGAPWWLPIAGGIFAIGVAKFAYGGLGFNIFNPALAGRAFLISSWPTLATKQVAIDGVTSATPLTLLKMQGELTSVKSVFIGTSIGGTIGETSALALLIGAVYLFYRGIIDWRIPFSYIGTVFILMTLFGQNPVFHIFAGGLMLGAFFMATDYVTSPTTKTGRVLFGIGCGVLTAIIRQYGGLPEGVMYSILLMNSLTPLIDRYTTPKPFGYSKRRV